MILAFDTMGLLVRKFHSRYCTSGVAGFADEACQMIRQFRPEHVVFAMEGGKGDRKGEHSGYKANRERNDSLIEQARTLDAILAPLNCFRVPGFEADDVLATLATRYPGCRIVSNDKDLFQLIGDAEMYDANRGAMVTKSYVRQKTGVEYHQVADWLALHGDAADCVPGVETIGPATAASMLLLYKTLDDVIDAAKKGRFDGTRFQKSAAKLIEQEDVARMSRRLVELRRDLELPPLKPIKTQQVLRTLEVHQ